MEGFAEEDGYLDVGEVATGGAGIGVMVGDNACAAAGCMTMRVSVAGVCLWCKGGGGGGGKRLGGGVSGGLEARHVGSSGGVAGGSGAVEQMATLGRSSSGIEKRKQVQGQQTRSKMVSFYWCFFSATSKQGRTKI
jgi:hypothetical protein